jgi:peptidoglycan/LPS O-acetylase OafA/YrhL
MTAPAARTPFIPPRGNPRFPLLDAIRALAALSVFAYHLTNYTQSNQYAWFGRFTSHLDIGVGVFFVISGFVLYRPFIVARHDGRRRRLSDYAVGRFLRLAPAYWVALTAAAIFPGVAGAFSGDWWIYYGLLQSYWPSRTLNGLPQAWSLVVEVSFYALLPLYALALHWLPKTRLLRFEVPLELALLTGLSAACLLFQRHVPATTIVYGFDWFAAGMALAVVSVAVARRPSEPAWVRVLGRWPGLAWGLALACWLVLCLGLGLSRNPPLPYTYVQWLMMNLLWAAIATLVVAPAVLAPESGGLVRRVLRGRVLMWLGLISYGIYLWHWTALLAVWKLGWTTVVAGRPILSYLVLAGPATIALAALSWYLVERPVLSLKLRVGGRRGRRRVAAPAA